MAFPRAFFRQDWERVEAERRRVKAAEMEERAKLKELGAPSWAVAGAMDGHGLVFFGLLGEDEYGGVWNL